MIVLDTSALLRFFSLDDHAKAEQVRDVLEGNQSVHIPDVVFPELEYVLSSSLYNVSRQKILNAFQTLEGIKVVKVSLKVKLAITIFTCTSLDMADCIVIASAMKNELLSYDKKLVKVHEYLERES